MFSSSLKRWNLLVDGPIVMTSTSALLPVIWRDMPAMLKVALHDEEKLGNHLMVCWKGGGAARVLEHAEDAILIERADADISLADSSQANMIERRGFTAGLEQGRSKPAKPTLRVPP